MEQHPIQSLMGTSMESIREMVDVNTVSAETSFVDDLGADSLDVVELTMALEEEFGVEEMSEEDLSGITTVGDLVKYLQTKLD